MSAGDEATAPHRTIEVRWIVDGECPVAAVERFNATRSEDPEERTDLYLATGSATTGVKSRDGGGFDVKVRRDSGPVVEASGVRGLVEEWDGWSFDASGGPEPDGTTWRPVAKRRWRRAWWLAPGSGPRRAGPDETLDAGATIELATLTAAGGTTAWTVAVEAWGIARDEALSGIGQVLSAERDHLPVDVLTVERSCSYPEWLDRDGPGSGRDGGDG